MASRQFTKNFEVSASLLGRWVRSTSTIALLAVISLLATAITATQSSGVSLRQTHSHLEAHVATSQCPWIAQALHHTANAMTLTNEVIARMSLNQKASFAILATYPPLENSNIGVPSLCIPPITLTDGPDGVANGLTGVTQFPAAIGIAAGFDPSVARAGGEAEGGEGNTRK